MYSLSLHDALPIFRMVELLACGEKPMLRDGYPIRHARRGQDRMVCEPPIRPGAHFLDVNRGKRRCCQRRKIGGLPDRSISCDCRLRASTSSREKEQW